MTDLYSELKQIKNIKRIKIIILITFIALIILLVIIRPTNIIYHISSTIFGSPYPDISTFAKKPTDIFILKNSDFNYIQSSTPFMGLKYACPHSGAHINFTNTGAPYEVEIITPVDGRISRIQKCFDLGLHDKFDISVEFASYKNSRVSLDYSIEPFDGLRCKNDPDYYSKYIKVVEGQEVKAGDVIAIMPKFSSDPKTGTHIHYNLMHNSKLLCPNIFSKDIVDSLAAKYMQGVCNGEPITENTLCFMAEDQEDIVSN